MSARPLLLAALVAALSCACRMRAPEPEGAAPAVEAGWNVCESALGTWVVRWRSEPERLEFGAPARLVVEAHRLDGLAADELRADAGMPQHGHGVLRRMQVEDLGQGRFAVENVYLHMPGAWRVYLDVGRAGVFERVELELEVD